MGVQHKLLNNGSQVTKEIKRRLQTRCPRVLLLETGTVESLSLHISLSSLTRDLIEMPTPGQEEPLDGNGIVMAETVNYITNSKLLLISGGQVEIIDNTDLEAGHALK